MSEEKKPNKFIGDESEAQAIIRAMQGDQETDQQNPEEEKPKGPKHPTIKPSQAVSDSPD